MFAAVLALYFVIDTITKRQLLMSRGLPTPCVLPLWQYGIDNLHWTHNIASPRLACWHVVVLLLFKKLYVTSTF